MVKADSPQSIPQDQRDTGGTLNNLLFSKCTPAAIAADPTLKAKCSFQYPVAITKHSIDWAKMESVRSPQVTGIDADHPGQAQAQAVLSSIFFCLMVIMILNGLLAMVPMIVGHLLGDLNQSPILGSKFNGAGSGNGQKSGLAGFGSAFANAVGNPLKKFSGVVGK